LKDDYSAEVVALALEQLGGGFPTLNGPLRADILWRQTGHGDVDNCLHRMKVVFDILGVAPKTAAGAHRSYLGLFGDDAQIACICIRRLRVFQKTAQNLSITLTGEL